MNKIIISSIIFILMSGLTGCATKSKEQVLLSTLRAYERVVRWGDLTKSNIFRKEPVVFSKADMDKFKSIKITGYRSQGVVVKNEATVTELVELRYYNDQYARERTIEDHQQWDYDADRNLWFISSPLPNF